MNIPRLFRRQRPIFLQTTGDGFNSTCAGVIARLLCSLAAKKSEVRSTVKIARNTRPIEAYSAR